MLFVETNGSEIGDAHFEQDFLRCERAGPFQGLKEKSRADARTANGSGDSKIQDFDVRNNAAGDQEAGDTLVHHSNPSSHFLSSDAFIVPGRPRSDFRRLCLNGEDCVDIVVLERANEGGRGGHG